MTDLRKAAEMAAYEVPLHELLEGVPEDAKLVIDSEDGMSTRFIPVGHLCKRAAEALRQALAESANSTTDFVEPKALAQPEQEPVGWADRFEFDKEGHDFWCNRQKPAKGGIPLYTAPPKREWSGLSLSEAEDLIAEFENDPLEMLFALEAHLREKNT